MSVLVLEDAVLVFGGSVLVNITVSILKKCGSKYGKISVSFLFIVRGWWVLIGVKWQINSLTKVFE